MDNFVPQQPMQSSLDSATRDKIAPPGTPPPPSPSFGEPDSGGFFARNKLFVGIFLVALVVITVFAVFAFRKSPVAAQPKVTLELSAPAEVPSSTEAVVRATITNNDSHALSGGELELVYPTGVVFVSSNPQPDNLSGTSFKVPALPPGANIAIFAKLRFEGGVGESRKFVGHLKYSVSGISAEFSRDAESTSRLVAAGVSIDVQGPASVTNSQLVTYTLHYANQSTQTFDRVRVKLAMPQGFQFAQSSPSPVQGTDTWDVGQLVPNASGDITVNGTFSSATPGASIPFSVQLLVPDKNGGYYTQAEGKFATTIQNQPLVISQALSSGDADHTLVAAPGSTLQYRISYQNNATTAARGVRIVFSVDSSTADLSSLQAEGAVISGNTVTWSAASSPDLEVLNPNESGNVSVSVRIKDPPVKDRTINPDLVTNVKIKADEYDTFLPGNKLQIKLSTHFGIEGTPTYLDGQKPPRVGQATRYTVTVALKSSTSDVADSVVTMYVATGGASFDKTSVSASEADAVTYDPSTGKVTWRVGTLRAHTGDFTPARSLQFALRVVPSSSQVSRPITLVKNVQFSGKDVNTTQTVSGKIDEITSTDGANNSYEGIVSQ
jgi:hypothetical protein